MKASPSTIPPKVALGIFKARLTPRKDKIVDQFLTWIVSASGPVTGLLPLAIAFTLRSIPEMRFEFQ
ncbi:hypothetical protein D5086_012869 [Populus alba]|uniref:Uncharacterized protein n=1 Tax=Populus alba TaxID=43335 RepID=A0ACC4C4N9_POPAL